MWSKASQSDTEARRSPARQRRGSRFEAETVRSGPLVNGMGCSCGWALHVRASIHSVKMESEAKGAGAPCARGWRWAFVAAALLLLPGCGPSERRIGVLVLHALPAIVIAGGLVQGLFRYFGGGRLPATRRTHGVLLGVSLAALAITIALRGLTTSGLVVLAFLGVGASYLAYLLVAMRLMKTTAFRWAALFPFVMIGGPALWLMVFGRAAPGGHASQWESYFMLPGYFGVVPALLVMLLALENLWWGDGASAPHPHDD